MSRIETRVNQSLSSIFIVYYATLIYRTPRTLLFLAHLQPLSMVFAGIVVHCICALYFLYGFYLDGPSFVYPVVASLIHPSTFPIPLASISVLLHRVSIMPISTFHGLKLKVQEVQQLSLQILMILLLPYLHFVTTYQPMPRFPQGPPSSLSKRMMAAGRRSRNQIGYKDVTQSGQLQAFRLSKVMDSGLVAAPNYFFVALIQI